MNPYRKETESVVDSVFLFAQSNNYAETRVAFDTLKLLEKGHPLPLTIAREEIALMSEYVSRPSLSHWGIEEVESNVCEDTFENRQKLTAAKIPFKILEPGLIETDFQDYDDLNKHHASMFEKRKPILRNQKDPWSDYIDMTDYPLDFMETAPAWIKRHMNKYEDAVAEGKPAHKIPILPNRCNRLRADGSRCWQWSWPAESAEGFCRQHCDKFAFNATAQMAKLNDAAKMRLSQLTEPSLAALEDLVLNSTVPHVRLKAATEVLDRVGIRGGTELTISGQVDHTVATPAEVVHERLNSLAERLKPTAELEAPTDPDVVEGEIISDSAETIQAEDPRDDR